MRAAPAVSCANAYAKKLHMSIQVQRKQSGLPCAMVYGLYRALPGETWLACHRRQRDAKHHRQLDTSHWGVRTTRLRRPLQPRSSVAAFASTASHRAFRDVRNAPLVGWDAGNTQLIWGKSKAEYFQRGYWTQRWCGRLDGQRRDCGWQTSEVATYTSEEVFELVIASEAKQSRAKPGAWIASSLRSSQ